MSRAALVLVLALAFAAQPADARIGDDGRGEARAVGVCSGGAAASLRLRSDANDIELRFEIDHTRARSVWRIALVQERRVVWKGAAKTTGPDGSLEVRRRLPDLPGADTVTARAWGPKGLTCNVTVTLVQG
jgi:hypothetical protein